MTENEYKEFLDEEKAVLDKEYEERFEAIRKLKSITKGTLEQKVDAILKHTIESLERDMADIQKESMDNVEEKGTIGDDEGEFGGSDDNEGVPGEG